MIKVSVLITTYNHEKYIAQALDSVVNQLVDFDYEVIIGDDCSSDNTVEIIESFKSRASFPVKLLLNQKNLGVTKNIQQCLKHCSGEFIAFLEGDDYWLSPLKLQKQVAFLEKNGNCSLCFNGFFLLKDNGVYYPHCIEKLTSKTFFTTQDLILHNFITNFSACMYRKSIVEKLPSSMYDIYTVDWMFNLANSLHGDLGCIPEQLSVYRQHSSGSWFGKSHTDKLNMILDLIPHYSAILGNEFNRSFTTLKDQLRIELFWEYLRHKNYLACAKMIPFFLKTYLGKLTSRLISSMKK